METTDIRNSLVSKVGFDPEYLPEFEKKVFIEGVLSKRRLVSFFVLLLLATIIATYGVLSSSTATVIGAMIVAPLMGPIMATTAAVIMGSSKRALNSLILVVIGVVAVVGLSTLLALIIPGITISFTHNPEITSRISPGLYALFTALAAGAAGAFITSRAEIADSIGGVAIAISLVPPLCVVGISISQGEWSAAGGAMLLFLTNFFAILLAGGITFMLVGLGKLTRAKADAKMRKRSFVLIVIGTLLVTIPLSLSAYRTVVSVDADQKATNVVDQWVDGSSDRVVTVDVQDHTISVIISGTGDQIQAAQLANELEAVLGYPVTLNLTLIPATVVVVESQ